MRRGNDFDALLMSIENLNTKFDPEDDRQKKKEKSKVELVDELLKELDDNDDIIPEKKPQKATTQPETTELTLADKLLTKQTPSNAYALNTDYSKEPNLNSSLDEEKFLQELEEEQQKELETKLALESILDTNKKKKNRVATGGAKSKAPHEMVKSQLGELEAQKTDFGVGFPISNLLLVEATSDFDPKSMYSEEQAQTMLELKKKEFVVVLAVFTPEWLAGYRLNDQNNSVGVQIFPLTLCKLAHQNLPKPKRDYEIKYWNTFGSLDKQAITSLRMSIAKHDTVFKSMQLSHIFKGTDALPKAVYYAVKDFNYDLFIPYAVDQIPLLSFMKGDMIVVTKQANAAGWCEGYVINKLEVSLGIFPKVFVSHIKFKFDTTN